jgi:hypothetical protein
MGEELNVVFLQKLLSSIRVFLKTQVHNAAHPNLLQKW